MISSSTVAPAFRNIVLRELVFRFHCRHCRKGTEMKLVSLNAEVDHSRILAVWRIMSADVLLSSRPYLQPLPLALASILADAVGGGARPFEQSVPLKAVPSLRAT